MPDLKDMKRTPEEVKEEVAEMKAPEVDEYPWGLQLNLDDEVVKKLAKDFKAGEQVTVVALATVKSVNTHEEETEEGGGVRSNACLQITEMAVEEAPKDKGARARSMYPSMADGE